MLMNTIEYIHALQKWFQTMCQCVIDKNQHTSDFDTVCGLQRPLAFIIENIMPRYQVFICWNMTLIKQVNREKTLPNVMEDEGQVEVDGLPLISRWTFLTLKWRLILVTHNEEIFYHKMALLSIEFIINMFWKLSFSTLTKNRWLLYLCLSFAWVLGTLPEFFMAFRIFNYLAS